jgi:tetratricopeptide (TPR) repeat protein
LRRALHGRGMRSTARKAALGRERKGAGRTRDRGVLDRAAPYLRLIIDNTETRPESEEASRLADLALSLWEARRWSRCIRACESAIAVEARCGWLHALHSGALAFAQRWEEAIAAAERAISIKPDDPWGVAVVQGLGLFCLGRYEEIIDKFTGNKAEAYLVRVPALKALGRTDEALEACESWITVEPEDPSAYVTLAELLFEEKRLAEAINYLNMGRALALNQNDVDNLDRISGEFSSISSILLNLAGNGIISYKFDMVLPDIFARLSAAELEELIVRGEEAKAELAHREDMVRGTGKPRPVPVDDAAREAISSKLSRELAWPAEKWRGSPEALSRKRYQIIAFLRRVWKPFIDNNDVIVTRAVLRERDVEAGRALDGYLRYHDMPADLRIIGDKQLKQFVAERPSLLQELIRTTNDPDMR